MTNQIARPSEDTTWLSVTNLSYEADEDSPFRLEHVNIPVGPVTSGNNMVSCTQESGRPFPKTTEEDSNANRKYVGRRGKSSSIVTALKEPVSHLMVSGPNIWVKPIRKTELSCIADDGGKVVKTYGFSAKTNGYCLLADDTLWICFPYTHTVRRMDLAAGSTLTKVVTAPLSPMCVASDHHGDVYVTLVRQWNLAKPSAQPNAVMKFSVNGKECARVDTTDFSPSGACYPYRITCNRGGSLVAVTCHTSEMSAHLVVLDGDLRLQWRYAGGESIIRSDAEKSRVDPEKSSSPSNPEKFGVSDVVIARDDLIVISEIYTKGIYMMDAVGEVLREVHVPTRPLVMDARSSGGEVVVWFADSEYINRVRWGRGK